MDFRFDIDIVNLSQKNLLNENKNMCICAAGIFVGWVHNIVTGKMNMNLNNVNVVFKKKVSIFCYKCVYIYLYIYIYVIYIYIYICNIYI